MSFAFKEIDPAHLRNNHTSVCSDNSSASSTSIPRYRTVLSSLGIAQISLSLNGAFWPISLPLFQGLEVRITTSSIGAPPRSEGAGYCDFLAGALAGVDPL